jgi:hypothetical protein
LDNPNVTLDENGREDFEKGRMDPRIVASLTKLAEKHRIVVSSTTSDHPQLTSGGSPSNHWFGRGIDIATVDGQVVNAGSDAARTLASELTELDPAIRPTEVGTPWPIAAPGFFTDARHQDHIHYAFDEPIDPGFRMPEGGAGRSPAAPPTPSAVAEPAPRSAPTPGAVSPRPDSGLFAAVAEPGEIASAAEKATSATDSNLFLQTIEPESQPPPAPAANAVPAESAGPVDLASAPTVYPGDDAPKEQVAAWMAAEAEKRGLPPQLPVMAALVESGLQNLNFGDADSVGFFQMRLSIRNQGEYAGYPDDPQKQIDWFLDTAEQVKAQRVAAGKSITDPSQFGEWIADVERPAEQFRGRYQLRLEEANGLLKSALAPHPRPSPASRPRPSCPSRSAARRRWRPARRSTPASSASTGPGAGRTPRRRRCSRTRTSSWTTRASPTSRPAGSTRASWAC